MSFLFLFDVAPEPISTGIGIAGLAFVTVVVLMITAAVLLGAVLLFRRIKKTGEQASSRIVLADVSLNPNRANSQTISQTDTLR